MWKQKLFVLNLVLLCLSGSGKAAEPNLPEPPLPACLIETQRGFGGGGGFGEGPYGLAVGRYEFSPKFLAELEASYASGNHKEALQAALLCASNTAKSLREGVNTIRRANEMLKRKVEK